MRTVLALSALCGTVRAIDPAHAANITVYHVNQNTYGAAPVNMNTGDARGDLYFDLRSVDLPIECAHPTSSNAHDCKNAEVISTNLVITKLVLEVDTSKYGDYGRCNVCVNGTDGHGDNNCTDGTYDCQCGDMHSSVPCGSAVGKSDLSVRYGNRTCGGEKTTEAEELDCWKLHASRKTGGYWYSTTASGWCDAPGAVAENCTWRVAQAVKRVNKTCSDNAIYTAAEKADAAGCFGKCAGGGKTGPARNTSDFCWIGCFYSTVLGPKAALPNATVSGMDIAALLSAWNSPFLSDDAAEGGCPALPIPPLAPRVAVRAW
jgi:hypothetical protein